MPILGIIPSRLSKYFPFPSALSLKPANDGQNPLSLSDSDIRHLAGNGFHWSSIGSILMFAWSVLLILLIMMLAQTHEASEPMRVDLSPRLLPLVFSVPRVPAPPLRLGAPPRADRFFLSFLTCLRNLVGYKVIFGLLVNPPLFSLLHARSLHHFLPLDSNVSVN